MDYDTQTDKELVARVAREDADALAALYDRYSRLVFSIAVNVVGNQLHAEEITLDIFQRLWVHAHKYDADRAKLTTWLSRMTRNRSIDLLRREGVRPEHNSIGWVDVPREPTTHHNPEASAALALQKQRIRTAVAQLPDAQRECLALSYFRGYSHREIAETLDQPLGTVKTRIRLAMQKLKLLLQDEENTI